MPIAIDAGGDARGGGAAQDIGGEVAVLHIHGHSPRFAQKVLRRAHSGRALGVVAISAHVHDGSLRPHTAVLETFNT